LDCERGAVDTVRLARSHVTRVHPIYHQYL
jgi:hypothetical protein